MSDKKNPPPVPGPLTSIIPGLKDMAILAGWIVGLILIAALAWFLTQQPRTRALQRSVNRVLQQYGDNRRLGAPVSPHEYPDTAGSMRMGVCFNVTGLFPARNENPDESSGGTARAFIFAFIGEGTFFPCAAMLTSDGKVKEFIALNSQGQRALGRISPGFLQIYARRIEGEGSP